MLPTINYNLASYTLNNRHMYIEFFLSVLLPLTELACESYIQCNKLVFGLWQRHIQEFVTTVAI